MALVRVTVQLRDSLPAEILLYVTSRSKLLDVLGGMGLEVEDDLEVRARVAGTDGMLIWCDEKIGEVDGVSQYCNWKYYCAEKTALISKSAKNRTNFSTQ